VNVTGQPPYGRTRGQRARIQVVVFENDALVFETEGTTARSSSPGPPAPRRSVSFCAEESRERCGKSETSRKA